MLRKVVKSVLWALLVLIVFQLAFSAYWIFLSPEKENPDHQAYKKEYLKTIEERSNSGSLPNIVIILFDDMGYGDIGAFGARSISTPSMDQLAAEGLRLTNYYSPAPNCTPSRAAMMTGRLPIHTSVTRVIFPRNSAIDLYQRRQRFTTRMLADEILLPEILKHAGYATKIVGKWHLGDVSPSLPNDFGFDEFFGLMYSNDTAPLNLYRNQEIIERQPIDQSKLTASYTREAVDFIAKNKESPFFLYLSHSFPHKPLHVSTERRGKSDGGLYGDVVEELDQSVHEVVDALDKAGALNNTLIIVTSDNGPWFQGNPGFHRGRKQDTFDGGMAVPLIAYWPGKIPAGVISNDLVSGLDIFPTILDLLNLPQPTDRKIDGFTMRPLLLEGESSQRKLLFYSNDDTLYGVRDKRFKYQASKPYSYGGPEIGAAGHTALMGPWIFDLQLDPNESYDVSDRYPEQFNRLQDVFNRQVKELKENPRGWIENGGA